MATTEIGGFHEVEEIGHGGMAVVYRAVEATSRQVVAIKLMSVELSGDLTFRKRFQREADVLQHFRHPAIVPILGHGEHNGQPYLVMPFLSGGTLADRLKGGPRPPGEVALLARIAGALDSAHRQGIIHRDVKPTNILFDAAGRPYLTDFGIVKLLGDTGTSVTQTGASLGTPGYMSPEQVRAQPLDGRCDVYALGVVLFEMLTGRLPYTATNPYAQAFQHVADPIPNLRAINPALAAGWQPIIERALAKERENRYPTAWAIIQDTGNLIDLSAPVLSPGGPSARPPTPSIRAAADPGAMSPNRAAPELSRHTPTEPLAAAGVGRQASPLAASGPAAAPRPAARPLAGRDGRTVAIVLLVVVALLALGGAAWLLLGGGRGASPAATPTATLPLSPTPTIPATPIPGQPALRLTRDADLRGGPGDDYPLVGQIAAGVAVTIVGRDAAGAWYNVQLGQGRGWLPGDAGELVDAADEPRIPVAGTIPPTATTAADTATATLTATPTDPPTRTPSPTMTPSPTATRPPPTSTPVPPTDTPLPPTNTPEPPPPPPPATDTPPPPPVPDTPSPPPATETATPEI